MVMLFNFGKKPTAPKPTTTTVAKVTAKVPVSSKPASSKQISKPATVQTKSSSSSYAPPNPTPEAFVDSSTDFFAFARSLPAWMKKKA